MSQDKHCREWDCSVYQACARRARTTSGLDTISIIVQHSKPSRITYSYSRILTFWHALHLHFLGSKCLPVLLVEVKLVWDWLEVRHFKITRLPFYLKNIFNYNFRQYKQMFCLSSILITVFGHWENGILHLRGLYSAIQPNRILQAGQNNKSLEYKAYRFMTMDQFSNLNGNCGWKQLKPEANIKLPE